MIGLGVNLEMIVCKGEYLMNKQEFEVIDLFADRVNDKIDELHKQGQFNDLLNELQAAHPYSEKALVAIALHMIRSGRVVLCGNYGNAFRPYR